MSVLVFVYGTLKEGFPNFALNPGRRVPGSFRTRLAFPLYVVRLPQEDRAPWLMNSPGQGVPVRGQVFEVDEPTLQRMDVFEEVGLPTGYVRVAIDLAACGDVPGQADCRAQAYLKAADQLPLCLHREGPFEEYTLALAQGYWLKQG